VLPIVGGARFGHVTLGSNVSCFFLLRPEF